MKKDIDIHYFISKERLVQETSRSKESEEFKINVRPVQQEKAELHITPSQSQPHMRERPLLQPLELRDQSNEIMNQVSVRTLNPSKSSRIHVTEVSGPLPHISTMGLLRNKLEDYHKPSPLRASLEFVTNFITTDRTESGRMSDAEFLKAHEEGLRHKPKVRSRPLLSLDLSRAIKRSSILVKEEDVSKLLEEMKIGSLSTKTSVYNSRINSVRGTPR